MGPRTDHHPFAAADAPSFHDLLDLVTADEQLDPRRKADVRSAINSLGQWLGSDLTAMPAHPRYLRERLAGFHPAAAGVSRKRLQNVRSAVAFALDRYGFGGRRDYLAPLSPASQTLHDRLPDKYLLCRLSRLLHFISAQGIEPEQMTDAVANEFLAALERQSAIKHVRTTHQDACRAWNKARAQVAGWPDVMLTEPCYQQSYGLPWTAFPASLEAAVDAWFADSVDDGDFFADNGRMKPLAPRTITTQKDHLRCTASALVRTGHDPAAIVDLAYLVRPAHVRQALTFFLGRNDGKPNAYIAAIAYSLRTAAKYGVDLSDSDRKEVERLYKKVAQQRHVSAADRARLETIVADRNRAQKHVARARIILASADRLRVAEVARRAGVGRPAVWRWQRRFAEAGVDSLLRDATRKPGRAPLADATVRRVVALTCAEPPGEATHWTGRAMAKASSISLRSVQRIWQAHDLQPHRIRTFKRSTDPDFAAKLADIVGLYVAPPKHALVLSIDEKSHVWMAPGSQEKS